MRDIIEQAAQAGIILYVEEEQLKYHQLGDEFPEEIQTLIKGQKENIVSYLAQKNEVSTGGNLLQRLASTVAATPNKIALTFEGESLTYQQFAGEVDKLAKFIAKHAGGEPVALLLDRGINTMVAIYAALRANVAYVPIDPSNPSERIAYYLQDAKSKLLITHTHYMTDGTNTSVSEVSIESALQDAHSADVALPELSEIEGGSGAYIIYTSGSTGAPKGVLCSHDNLAYFGEVMASQYQALGLDSDATWLWNASYAFDASMKSVVSLAYGKSIVVPSDVDVKAPRSIIALIQAHNVSVLNAPPVVMEYILPHLETTNTQIHLIVSGDDVAPSLWQKLYDYSDACGTKVLNAYGPTETTVNATYDVLSCALEVSIGRAVEGTETFVLDADLNEVAEGSEGELYIAGRGVALGYINNESATAANFVTLEGSDQRVFKTGDLVKRLDNDRLQFVGRNDDQVKYRGYRVELGEIKETIKLYDGIRDAAVVTNGQGGDLRIEAYLVATENGPSVADVTEYLQQTLPEYMHPTKIALVDEIPLTVGGKVDKNRLIEPIVTAAPAGDQGAQDIESRMSAIWIDVLKVPEVQPENSFFELGGHSLLAMQLLQRVDAEFGIVMETRDLFSLLTLQSQIDWVKENSNQADIEQLISGGASEAHNTESTESVELEL